ncbi:hypothetical protein SODALDRAFT_350707 [Sodiomyces alkalinus F11]|uniref:UspA domain-containing protein n=1 Tax=Sodiomyces alkalinus (strain CBS 110278 / VKM F-3762 / F11) TaxID=1314773 RepID=A0A3N2PVH5_SODAK|nr:hypothetical protein SODALDRAFT_350707 [Sodiomyces alkalinus F11]ROT38484.1 hypothetical protein SODALDRAFT_350707 [Sodiomyces alkalinus F11]
MSSPTPRISIHTSPASPPNQPAHEAGPSTDTDDNRASCSETTRGRPTIRIKGQNTPRPLALSRDSSAGSSAHLGWASDSTVRPSQGRRGSVSSLSFAPVRNPELPQGTHKKTDKERIRASSPPPARFQSRVAFDNVQLGEATKRNTSSLTLNVRHRGFQLKRRSRMFMVGIDEHEYSDEALQWLLDEMVDDGDEVVCVRVVENMTKTMQSYQQDAHALMGSILAKNEANRAINFTLEYASGKLHATFHKLIQIYQPAMLIVGTRGRSLGGFQSLVNTRNSFSQYCLQYSPIPVVVVRPTAQRDKKRNKRQQDTERQTYAKMLTATGGKHETDSARTIRYATEVKYSAEEEAHHVARALGLPASFDPTIKPLNVQLGRRLKQQTEGSSLSASPSRSPLSVTVTSADTKEDEEEKEAEAEAKAEAEAEKKEEGPETEEVQAQVQTQVLPMSAVGDVGDGDGNDDGDEEDDDDNDDDDEDDEEGFEAIPGEEALGRDQQDRLHDMEVGEAAALLKQNRRQSMGSGGTDDDSDGGKQGGEGGSKS